VAAQNEFTDTAPLVNTDESYNSKDRHTLYSTLKYCYDYGGFHGEFDSATGLNDIIRLRSKEESSYFRKQSDQVLKSLGSLDLNMNGTPDLNMNGTPDLNMNYTTMSNKCDTCSSSNVEFDNSLGCFVCMGCGGELVYDLLNDMVEVIL
jgi:hypothetical protein